MRRCPEWHGCPDDTLAASRRTKLDRLARERADRQFDLPLGIDAPDCQRLPLDTCHPANWLERRPARHDQPALACCPYYALPDEFFFELRRIGPGVLASRREHRYPEQPPVPGQNGIPFRSPDPRE
jgi:hypothetical protein